MHNFKLNNLNQSQNIELAHNKIAQDIHDSLAQTLASLTLRVEVLEKNLYSHNVDQKLINNAIKLKLGIERANIEIRGLIKNFRAPRIAHFRSAIENLVAEFKNSSPIKIFLQYNCNPLSIDIETKTHIFRIIQELLANVKKHSQAKFVRVLITCNQHIFQLLIEDDGIGFGQTSIDDSSHFGLSVMQERAEQINAKLVFEHELNEGCRIKLLLDTIKAKIK